MPKPANQGPQRTNTSSPTGRKERSPTSTPHKGSRVEPSHVNDKAGQERAKDAAEKAIKAAKKAPKKKP